MDRCEEMAVGMLPEVGKGDRQESFDRWDYEDFAGTHENYLYGVCGECLIFEQRLAACAAGSYRRCDFESVGGTCGNGNRQKFCIRKAGVGIESGGSLRT